MKNNEEYIELIRFVIEEINTQLDCSQKLECNLDERLNSDESKLDSLGMLTFINILEDKCLELSINIDFMNILMNGDSEKVLNTVGSLVKYIENNK